MYICVTGADGMQMMEPEMGVGLAEASRRRRRSAEERRLIVEQTLEPGSPVARVARRYGINANQLFQWRRLYRSGALGGFPASELRLLPVSVAEDAAPAKPVEAPAVRAGRASAWKAWSTPRLPARCWIACVGDRASGGHAHLDRGRGHGHAPGFSGTQRPGADGA